MENHHAPGGITERFGVSSLTKGEDNEKENMGNLQAPGRITDKSSILMVLEDILEKNIENFKAAVGITERFGVSGSLTKGEDNEKMTEKQMRHDENWISEPIPWGYMNICCLRSLEMTEKQRRHQENWIWGPIIWENIDMDYLRSLEMTEKQRRHKENWIWVPMIWDSKDMNSLRLLQKAYSKLPTAIATATATAIDTAIRFYLQLLYVAVLSYFLRLYFSSGWNGRHVLRWTFKAVLLVLWMCGDVEQNPGPANAKRLARSEILRKFRRFTQMPLLKIIYMNHGKEIPKAPYKTSPPGWDEYMPEIEFHSISNTKSGEEEIFDKMLSLIEKKQMLLPDCWLDMLQHYNNLKAKRNEEASKTAIEQWILKQEIVHEYLPKISEYFRKTNILTEEMKKIFKYIQLKVKKSGQSHGVSDRSSSCVENWGEEGEFSQANVPAISHTFDTNSEVPNPSTKKRPASNSVKDVADTQGISDTKKFKRNKDDPETKRPTANSVKDVADTQGISDTEKCQRNKDDPEKCMSNQQQNLDMQGEYQSGSAYDTVGDLDIQPSSEVPTDRYMVQNANLPGAGDELLKKCIPNEQQSLNVHEEYPSLGIEGCMNGITGHSDVQSSLEDPKLLQSSYDDEEKLLKGLGSEDITLSDLYEPEILTILLRMYSEDQSISQPSDEMADLCQQISKKRNSRTLISI